MVIVSMQYVHVCDRVSVWLYWVCTCLGPWQHGYTGYVTIWGWVLNLDQPIIEQILRKRADLQPWQGKQIPGKLQLLVFALIS